MSTPVSYYTDLQGRTRPIYQGRSTRRRGIDIPMKIVKVGSREVQQFNIDLIPFVAELDLYPNGQFGAVGTNGFTVWYGSIKDNRDELRQIIKRDNPSFHRGPSILPTGTGLAEEYGLIESE